MAQIPLYNSPQVNSTTLPSTRQRSIASPELFGAEAEQQIAVGRGMLAAGTGLSNVAVAQQDRENADRLFAAETKLKDDYLAFEDDVRTNRRGIASWGVTRDTDKWFADQEKTHSETLDNDLQRKLFGQTLAKMRLSALDSVSRYEAGERRQSLEESARASIVGSINLAARLAAQGDATAEAIGGHKLDILNRVQVLADVNGWAPERRALEYTTHLTNLHKQVIQNLTDANPTRAREYFDLNREEIHGSEYDRIDRTLRLSEVKQAGFEFAERPDIRALATDEDRLTAARDFFKSEPEKREAAIREIKTRAAEQTQLRERAQRDAADTAWGIFARTGRLADIPAHVTASMDGRDWMNLKATAGAQLAGKDIKTDFSTWYDVNRRIAAGEKVNLLSYANAIGLSDLKQLARQMTNPDTVKEAATLTQQLSNTHDLMKWGSSDKEKKGAFDKAVTDAISQEQRQKGKPLTYEERQTVIDRMLIEGDINGALPFGKRRFFEVQGKPEAEKFVPANPTPEMLKLGMADAQTKQRFDAYVGQRVRTVEQQRGQPITAEEHEFILNDTARKWYMPGYDMRHGSNMFTPATFGELASKRGGFSNPVGSYLFDLGEAKFPGKFIDKTEARYYILRTPDHDRAKVEAAYEAVAVLFGDKIEPMPSVGRELETSIHGVPADRHRARDTFYTQYVLPAMQIAEQTGMPNTPEFWITYATQARRGRPMTAESIGEIMTELRGLQRRAAEEQGIRGR